MGMRNMKEINFIKEQRKEIRGKITTVEEGIENGKVKI